MATFETKYQVMVQTTTIIQISATQQQFEVYMFECENYPTFDNSNGGWAKVVGRIVGQQGTEAKVSVMFFSPATTKWLRVESKGSADIIIPKINIANR